MAVLTQRAWICDGCGEYVVTEGALPSGWVIVETRLAFVDASKEAWLDPEGAKADVESHLCPPCAQRFRREIFAPGAVLVRSVVPYLLGYDQQPSPQAEASDRD